MSDSATALNQSVAAPSALGYCSPAGTAAERNRDGGQAGPGEVHTLCPAWFDSMARNWDSPLLPMAGASPDDDGGDEPTASAALGGEAETTVIEGGGTDASMESESNDDHSTTVIVSTPPPSEPPAPPEPQAHEHAEFAELAGRLETLEGEVATLKEALTAAAVAEPPAEPPAPAPAPNEPPQDERPPKRQLWLYRKPFSRGEE